MIIANFLYMIVIILIFTAAPTAGRMTSIRSQDLFGILILLVFFWLFNKFHFSRIKRDLDSDIISLQHAKRLFHRTIAINTLISILFFSIEVYFFNYKLFISKIPYMNYSQTVIIFSGLLLFFLHLIIIWFHAWHAMGRTLELGDSALNYVWAYTKFNAAILLPYLAILAVIDLITLLNVPTLTDLTNLILFQIFLIFLVMVVFAPLLIIRLWDCHPLQPSPLTESITAYCSSQGVKFRQIMSWNALNKGLVTAAVIGVFHITRYLLITPRLMNLLNHDEILAVVSHEVGHVKKRHIFYYFIFIISFVILGFKLIEHIYMWFFNSKLGFEAFIRFEGQSLVTFQTIFQVILFIVFFVLFFRFIFGYFMRHFERQADIYCFESGINPAHLISSFSKLGEKMGESSKRSNWHHFNIPQRIHFLQKCSDQPGLIRAQNKKINTALLCFLISTLGLYLFFNHLQSNPDIQKYITYMEQKVKSDRLDPKYGRQFARIYNYQGEKFYQQQEWQKAMDAYEASLQLHDRQPGVLNNLAWLLLTCEDKRLRDPERALRLAKDAVRLNASQEVMDTLAEAYFQNGMFKEAYLIAKKVMQIAVSNRVYFRKQLQKMKKAYLESKSLIKI